MFLVKKLDKPDLLRWHHSTSETWSNFGFELLSAVFYVQVNPCSTFSGQIQHEFGEYDQTLSAVLASTNGITLCFDTLSNRSLKCIFVLKFPYFLFFCHTLKTSDIPNSTDTTFFQPYPSKSICFMGNEWDSKWSISLDNIYCGSIQHKWCYVISSWLWNRNSLSAQGTRWKYQGTIHMYSYVQYMNINKWTMNNHNIKPTWRLSFKAFKVVLHTEHHS